MISFFSFLFFTKKRFGEESLHNCEVMLKDIEDSKRANVAVHSALKTQAKKATVLLFHKLAFLRTSDELFYAFVFTRETVTYRPLEILSMN